LNSLGNIKFSYERFHEDILSANYTNFYKGNKDMHESLLTNFLKWIEKCSSAKLTFK